MLLGVTATAQTNFTIAAEAFENDEFEKTLSILSQLEAKMGANPKIESLRSFAYDQSGDKKKAYASVLKFFALSGRNSTTPGTKDMENLEITLKTFFENEFKQKQQQLETIRLETANTLVERKKSSQNNRATEKQTKYDSYYEAKIKNGKEGFTSAEIKVIKENIKSEQAEKLNEMLADANNGNAEAMYRVALKETNDSKKEEWLLKAAEKDHFKAIVELGKLYFYIGPKKNVSKAIFWLTKTADLGDLSSMDMLGTTYLLNFFDGSKTDIDKAIFYLTKAAEKGYLESACTLRNIYGDKKAKKDKKLEAYWQARCN